MGAETVENLEFGEKSTLYKKNGDAHHTFRGGPLKKLMGVGGTFSASFNIGIFFHDHCLYRIFFFSSFSCLLESGRLYCCNLNLDTRHNLIVWNRLQTKY